MTSEDLTINSYNQNAKSWAEAHSSYDFWKDEFEIFQSLLPTGKILEIGCGGGRDAHNLLHAGYDYVGTDAAKGFVQVAQQNNPSGTFLVMKADELDFPENSFDGFWASAVLLHIPKEKIDSVLKRLHSCVKVNGIGFIAIKEGEGEVVKAEERSDGKIYNLFWAFYTDKEFKGILVNNNFRIEKYIYKPMSERTKWLLYFVRAV